MPSYVIVGASRGIGYQFLKTLSADSSNTVIGLARKPADVEQQIKADGLSNITVLAGDLTDSVSLNEAAKKVSTITGGSLDYLIVNGAYLSHDTQWLSPSEFTGKDKLLSQEIAKIMETNVVGVAYSINAFLDLTRKSSIKKVIAISSGHADEALVAKLKVGGAVPYALSKYALNLLIAKYAVELEKEKIFFLSLSPGMVATSANAPDSVAEADVPKFQEFVTKLVEYDPTFKGPITPESSVTQMLETIQRLGLEQSGAFLSHHGDKNWL